MIKLSISEELCVNIISSEDWHDRGEFVLSRPRSHVKKALSRRIRYLTQLTLSSVSPNTLRSNIKLYIIIISAAQNTNHCTAQADIMIGWNIFVCCLITDVLLYFYSLSVSILYLIIFVSAEIYLPLLVIKWFSFDKIFNLTCHRSNVFQGLHCFYEKHIHHFLN